MCLCSFTVIQQLCGNNRAVYIHEGSNRTDLFQKLCSYIYLRCGFLQATKEGSFRRHTIDSKVSQLVHQMTPHSPKVDFIFSSCSGQIERKTGVTLRLVYIDDVSFLGLFPGAAANSARCPSFYAGCPSSPSSSFVLPF